MREGRLEGERNTRALCMSLCVSLCMCPYARVTAQVVCAADYYYYYCYSYYYNYS